MYKICIYNASPVCYAEKMYHTLREYLEKHVTLVAKKLASVDPPDFLSAYVEQWKLFSIGVEASNSLFDYLVHKIPLSSKIYLINDQYFLKTG